MTPDSKSLFVVGSANSDLVAGVDRLPAEGETVLGGSLTQFAAPVRQPDLGRPNFALPRLSNRPVTGGSPRSVLEPFRCPLDTRKRADNVFPSSYGVSGVTICAAPIWNGGIPDRQVGDALSLLQISSPASYVLLCRIPRGWETANNVVGFNGFNASNGHNPDQPKSADWGLFSGKTPYGFADGHVLLMTPDQMQAVRPDRWTVNR
jgi:prepilin-type processing-associated H-X9-DG protein